MNSAPRSGVYNSSFPFPALMSSHYDVPPAHVHDEQDAGPSTTGTRPISIPGANTNRSSPLQYDHMEYAWTRGNNGFNPIGVDSFGHFQDDDAGAFCTGCENTFFHQFEHAQATWNPGNVIAGQEAWNRNFDSNADEDPQYHHCCESNSAFCIGCARPLVNRNSYGMGYAGRHPNTAPTEYHYGFTIPFLGMPFDLGDPYDNVGLPTHFAWSAEYYATGFYDMGYTRKPRVNHGGFELMQLHLFLTELVKCNLRYQTWCTLSRNGIDFYDTALWCISLFNIGTKSLALRSNFFNPSPNFNNITFNSMGVGYDCQDFLQKLMYETIELEDYDSLLSTLSDALANKIEYTRCIGKCMQNSCSGRDLVSKRLVEIIDKALYLIFPDQTITVEQFAQFSQRDDHFSGFNATRSASRRSSQSNHISRDGDAGYRNLVDHPVRFDFRNDAGQSGVLEANNMGRAFNETLVPQSHYIGGNENDDFDQSSSSDSDSDSVSLCSVTTPTSSIDVPLGMRDLPGRTSTPSLTQRPQRVGVVPEDYRINTWVDDNNAIVTDEHDEIMADDLDNIALEDIAGVKIHLRSLGIIDNYTRPNPRIANAARLLYSYKNTKLVNGENFFKVYVTCTRVTTVQDEELPKPSETYDDDFDYDNGDYDGDQDHEQTDAEPRLPYNDDDFDTFVSYPRFDFSGYSYDTLDKYESYTVLSSFLNKFPVVRNEEINPPTYHLCIPTKAIWKSPEHIKFINGLFVDLNGLEPRTHLAFIHPSLYQTGRLAITCAEFIYRANNNLCLSCGNHFAEKNSNCVLDFKSYLGYRCILHPFYHMYYNVFI